MGVFDSIIKYLRVYRTYIGRRLYLVFALTVLAALAEGLGITLLLPLLHATEAGDGEIDGPIQDALQGMLDWMGIGDSVGWILLFIGIVFLAKGLLKFAEGGYRGYLQSRLMRELRARMFDAYTSMDYRYYIRQNTGHFINVINTQVYNFYRSFEQFSSFLSRVITAVAYFAVAFVLAWRFALMAVVLGIVLLFAFKYLNAYVRRLSRNVSSENSQLNKLLVQSLQAFKYIVSTDQVRHLRDGVMGSIRRLTDYQFRQKLAGAFTSAIREPLSVFFIIVVIAIQVVVFNDPVAPIFVALILFHRGMTTTIGIQENWQKTMDKIGSLEMVAAEFAAVDYWKAGTGSRPVGPLSKEIGMQGVCFRYDEDENDVLRDVSVTIPANSTVAFVGESGAGKSTLVDILTLMLRPHQGQMLIDDVPGEEVELSSWRSQIGYVSQETAIFDDTVANNISLWKGDYRKDPEVRKKVEEAARRAYARHFIEELPAGYYTVVGDRGVRLSGGQRQRLFIARELFKNPNLLILDEATSALDTESERYIQESIDRLKGSMTVVIIAHRLSTIRNVDMVYVLDAGRIVEQGTYDALTTAQNGRFREMVEMQRLDVAEST